ncbi:MAG TPA: hypothetical protein PLF30_02610 [Candidatus Moranbacteria bacterium]|jgi:hypothetical protein|nr:hypothetical protein [Candidatus Moranbacteria bacterium]HOF42669.1 hypothetical protein [Candidatus Moranbacteria bacterium]HPX94423.1 hypothetical protein [Candidatus Moranbacteria bacterium]HQB59433.1 hypothetical protein [Candidatus Moranbacteria bacterium]
MKKLFLEVLAILSVITILYAIGDLTVSAYKERCTDKRPLVSVEEINFTPEHYIRKGDYMHINEDVWHSKIYQDFRNGISDKWVTEYKYVYKLKKNTVRNFSRVAYRNAHPNDAVDKWVIFSNNLPDPKDFRIEQ